MKQLLLRRYSILDIVLIYLIVGLTINYGMWYLLLIIPAIVTSVTLENHYLKDGK